VLSVRTAAAAAARERLSVVDNSRTLWESPAHIFSLKNLAYLSMQPPLPLSAATVHRRFFSQTPPERSPACNLSSLLVESVSQIFFYSRLSFWLAMYVHVFLQEASRFSSCSSAVIVF